MSPVNTLKMLVRREMWEHRSLWIVPLVMAGVLLLSVALGGLHVSDGDFSIGRSSGPEYGQLPPEDRARVAGELHKHADKLDFLYAMSISILTTIELFAICIVVFFYLLDCLLQERKDRSILFWKSMPVSDGQVVTSKVLTALVVAPAITLAISAVLQVLVGAVVWMRFGHSAIGEFLPVWNPSVWFQVQLAYLLFIPTAIIWYLPFVGYLLLVSVWARKNAFLWAVLPWVSLLLIEALLFQSHRVADFLGHRFVGVFELMEIETPQGRFNPELMDLSIGNWIGHIGNVFASYKTWLSAAAGIAMIFAATRIRRYRDDS